MKTLQYISVFTVALVLMGAGCAPTKTDKTKFVPNITIIGAPVPDDVEATYGDPITIELGQTAEFQDGFRVKLDLVRDSRCPEGKTCVWAGEISAVLSVQDERGGRSILLGPVTKPGILAHGYDFNLLHITKNDVALIVAPGEQN